MQMVISPKQTLHNCQTQVTKLWTFATNSVTKRFSSCHSNQNINTERVLVEWTQWSQNEVSRMFSNSPPISVTKSGWFFKNSLHLFIHSTRTSTLISTNLKINIKKETCPMTFQAKICSHHVFLPFSRNKFLRLFQDSDWLFQDSKFHLKSFHS